MSSRSSHAAPRSSWHLAQIQIEEAEKTALKQGSEIVQLPGDPTYRSLVVAYVPPSLRHAPRFSYVAIYDQHADGWPEKGRTEKKIAREEAIGLVQEGMEVAASRAVVSDEEIRKTMPASAEMQRLIERVVEEQPLMGPRHL